MSILISGSIAFDILLEYEGRFADNILPDQIDRLSLSMLTPRMRHEYGGCAGNIAYAVHQLGGQALPLATVGQDGQRYIQRLQHMGINTSCIAVADDCYTAQCTLVTDQNQNQIAAFHPGAMNLAHHNPVPTDRTIRAAIVSPNGKEAMITHAAQLHAAGVPFVFDPGQGLPMFDADELQQFIQQATWAVVNEYEAHLLCQKLGYDRAAISRQLRALVVTLGEKGCEVWSDGVCEQIAPEAPATVADPTGCGDAWRGALLYGLAQGWDMHRCARLGNYMGALKVAHHGSQNYQIDAAVVARY